MYQTKKLDLPGIGSFTLDAEAVLPQESDRIGQMAASGITFTNANIAVADDALITFIKEHTGKMKSLAAADLDFYLTTGRQLLNIGKPFYLEGIGTLIKNNQGKLDFSPGDYLIPKIEDLRHPEWRGGASTSSYDEPPREEPKGNTIRQTLLLIGLVGGLIVIAWGGYYLYKRNNYTEPATENRATVIPETTVVRPADTTGLVAGKPAGDSVASTGSAGVAAKPADTQSAKPGEAAAAKPAVEPPPVVAREPVPSQGQSLYRFVILRTPNKNHALRRYNQLLGYQLNIKMEQKDSTYFKLYFPIAAAIRDTTHIRDSLADVYAAQVSIEH